MRAYLLKRLLLIPITLFGITLLTFLVMKLAPGDPAKILRSQAGGGSMQATQANLEAIENWKKERHLDKSTLTQYGYWLLDLVRLDLGRSLMTGRPRVSAVILDKVWVTLSLSLISIVLIYLVAIPVGVVCGAKQFTIWDRVLTVAVFLLYSLPVFWIGTLLIAFCTGRLFPTSGYYPDELSKVGFWTWSVEWLRHSVLPLICMTYAGFAFLSRQMRSSLLEQIRQDFVRTARAKGLPERVVILKHATRNALIPIVTLFGTLLPGLIGGNIVIEYLFSIPGMGTLLFQAILERDYTVIMGIEVISALLTLIGILISDLLYVAVNPTIAYE